MQAIVTKYHGPTDVKGSRISATCAAGRIISNYPDELRIEDAHRFAAAKLCEKLGWNYQFVTGGLKDGSFVHVFVN